MATPGTSDWSALRIVSSTSMKNVIASSLLHLANPASGPLILHALPSRVAAQSAQDIHIHIPKGSHAALGKLVSVAEIVKREFQDHQRATWEREDERERRKASKRSTKRKRASDFMDAVTVATPPDGETATRAAFTQSDSAQDHNADASIHPGPSNLPGKPVKRTLLRLFQYNVLDTYERLIASSSKLAPSNVEQDAESESDSDEFTSEEEVDKDEQNAIREVNGNNFSELPAKRALDEAIRLQVVEERKRPRKKHTPHLLIVLNSTRLPEYEAELRKHEIEYTLQLPEKARRGRKRKRKGKSDGDGDGEGEGEGDGAEASQAIVDERGVIAEDRDAQQIAEELIAPKANPISEVMAAAVSAASVDNTMTGGSQGAMRVDQAPGPDQGDGENHVSSSSRVLQPGSPMGPMGPASSDDHRSPPLEPISVPVEGTASTTSAPMATAPENLASQTAG